MNLRESQYRLLAAVLLLSALLLLSPFFYGRKSKELPVFSGAPGYWQILPDIGMARIVPLSSASLVAPAAGAGIQSLRLPATNSPLRKY